MYVVIETTKHGGHTQWTESKPHIFNTYEEMEKWIWTLTFSRFNSLRVFKSEEVKLRLHIEEKSKIDIMNEDR